MKRTVSIDPRFIERVHARFNERAWLQTLCVEGSCLEPWLRAGDVVWIDRALSPLPGDIVLAALLFKPVTRDPGAPVAVRRLTLKQYQEHEGENWLTSREGWIRCRPTALRGVAVQFYRCEESRQHPLTTMAGFVEFRDAPLRAVHPLSTVEYRA